MGRVKTEYVIYVCLLCMIGFFLCKDKIESIFSSISHEDSRTPLSSLGQIESSETSLFIYRAYLDSRGPSTKLRVLSFNQCNARALHVQIDGVLMPLEPISQMHQCPEKWAPGCSLVAHFHELEVSNESLLGKEITIQGPSDEQAVLPLYRAEPAKELGITVCIAPMFWYTDWTKLIVFIEYWRGQQAENIMVYVHSTTADVREVLDFYEKKGWITIVPWSTLPKSASFEPNDLVYRLGQVLAHNDCFLRTNTEFATAVDIDELLYSMKEPLTNYVLKNFANKTVGSLTFPHRGAVFDPPLNPRPFSFENVEYKGVLNFRYNGLFKAPKLIARTNAVESMSIHHVIAFRNGEVNERAQDAVLFHIRYDINAPASKMNTTNLVADPEWFQQTLLSRTRSIFPNGASFNEETQIALGKCTDSWRETQANCKAPVTFCGQYVLLKENWVEETESVFTVL